MKAQMAMIVRDLFGRAASFESGEDKIGWRDGTNLIGRLDVMFPGRWGGNDQSFPQGEVTFGSKDK